MIDRHHLLECILWPNGDGTFRKIVNTMKRLDELGVYKDYKLTIPIEHGAHSSMHKQFKEGTEYGQSGDKNPMYGKGYLISGEKAPWYGKPREKHPMYGRTGDKAPMYGRSGDKSPTWKGDKAKPSSMYVRALKLYKSGQITGDELQSFRNAKQEYEREKRRKKLILP